jgi:nucleoside-diphosphate-sugar epimerase
VYGPRQMLRHNRQGFIGWFIRLAIENRTIQIFGDGSQLRDFVYVDDVVNANILIGTESGNRNRIYNVGSGTKISISELARMEVRLFARSENVTEFPITYSKEKIGDITQSWADIMKIRTDAGFDPAISIEEGLRRYLNWFVKNKKSIATRI